MLWKKGWWDTRWLFLIGLASIFLAYGMTFGGGGYDAARWAERLQRSAYLSESYFYHGRIPWIGLLISLILSAVFMFAAVRIYERRDL